MLSPRILSLEFPYYWDGPVKLHSQWQDLLSAASIKSVN